MITMSTVGTIIFIIACVFGIPWSKTFSSSASAKECQVRMAFIEPKIFFTCSSTASGGYWSVNLLGGLNILPSSSNSDYQLQNGSGQNTLTILTFNSSLPPYQIYYYVFDDIICCWNLIAINVTMETISYVAELTYGDKVNLSCNISFWYDSQLTNIPPINMSISDNMGLIFYRADLTNLTGDRWINTTTVTLNSTEKVQYFCKVWLNGSSERTFSTPLLHVSYPVRTAKILAGSFSSLAVGDIIRCEADAYPTVNRVLWIQFNGSDNSSTQLSDGPSSQLVLEVSGNVKLRCIAFNVVKNVTFNASSPDIQLQIKPSFINNTSQNIGLIVGLCVGLGLPLIVCIVTLIICCLVKHRTNHGKHEVHKANGCVNSNVDAPIRELKINDMILVDNQVYDKGPAESVSSNQKPLAIANAVQPSITSNGFRSNDVYASVSRKKKKKTNVAHSPNTDATMEVRTDATLSSSSTDLTLIDSTVYEASTCAQSSSSSPPDTALEKASRSDDIVQPNDYALEPQGDSIFSASSLDLALVDSKLYGGFYNVISPTISPGGLYSTLDECLME